MCYENPNLTTYLSTSKEKSIFFYDTTCTEITNFINNFKTGKASDIPIVVIKHCGSIMSPVLASIINKSMINGKFLSILKTGKITPVYKKGVKDNIANYHSVSILPIFGKIFKKVLFSRIYEFCIQEKILSEDQFGFQKGHSTTHALHESIDFIKHAHNRGKHILAIFIDLSKAFDTIDYFKLQQKLNAYGIRGVANDLLKSYLTDRAQQVSVNGTLSDMEQVKFGVPQGSVLGPLLFLLYINDLKLCCNNLKIACKFILYADDTNIFIIRIRHQYIY